jgi:uncharacterized protein YjbI with pentapeptide repeats
MKKTVHVLKYFLFVMTLSVVCFTGNLFGEGLVDFKAAREGDAEAQYQLGKLYMTGKGKENAGLVSQPNKTKTISMGKQPKRAIKEWSLCAEQAYAPCQNALGIIYYFGSGKESLDRNIIDTAKGLALILSAVKQGDEKAIQNLTKIEELEEKKRKKEENRIATKKAMEEEIRINEEKRIVEEKRMAEKKIADAKADEKRMAEKKIADAKVAEIKKIADAKAAEVKKVTDAKASEEKKVADAKAAEVKKVADAKAAEDQRIAETKAAESKNTPEKIKKNLMKLRMTKDCKDCGFAGSVIKLEKAGTYQLSKTDLTGTQIVSTIQRTIRSGKEGVSVQIEKDVRVGYKDVAATIEGNRLSKINLSKQKFKSFSVAPNTLYTGPCLRSNGNIDGLCKRQVQTINKNRIDMTEANFEKTAIDVVNLSHVDLGRSNFHGSTFGDLKIAETLGTEANFSNVTILNVLHLKSSTFKGANFSGLSQPCDKSNHSTRTKPAKGCPYERLTYTRSQTEKDYCLTNLRDLLTRTQGSVFVLENNTEIIEECTNNPRTTTIEFYYSDLSDSNFSSADLAGANFANATMIGVDLSKANVSGANFEGADLTGADLRGTDISGALFDGANLSKVEFSEKQLEGVNLDKAIQCKTKMPWGEETNDLCK